MSTYDKLHKEQDEFIKKSFQVDKVSSQPVFQDFNDFLEKSNVKTHKYTYKQRKLVIVLLILLVFSVGINFVLISNPEGLDTIASILHLNSNFNNVITTNTTEDSNKDNDTTNNNNIENIAESENTNTEIIENNQVNVAKTENTNSLRNTNTVEETSTNTTKNPTIIAEAPPLSEIDLKELETVIKNYSYGIERIDPEDESLETNTTLLIIAKKYFDSIPGKIAAKDGAKYASTAANIHVFIKELTGNNITNGEYIKSYNNYIGYNQSSKSYIYGNDAKNITSEKYECKNLTLMEQNEDTYSAKATITRTSENKKITPENKKPYIETNYDIEFTFKINKDYKYQKYYITSLKSKNTSFEPDNTLHLVDEDIEKVGN